MIRKIPQLIESRGIFTKYFLFYSNRKLTLAFVIVISPAASVSLVAALSSISIVFILAKG
jgi:hypothetical protein